MAIFDDVVSNSGNFKGYTGNPPTTEVEYNALDCWKDSALVPNWAEIESKMSLAGVQQSRAEAYPSIIDQLDDIYHNGLAGWKANIKTIKNKYPKG
jgi:hypothetical protein